MFENTKMPDCEAIMCPRPIDSGINNRKEAVEHKRKEL